MEPGASEYDLIFTIVDGPPLDIGVELPDEAKRPIKEVKQLLEAAVNARTFVISVSILKWVKVGYNFDSCSSKS